MANATTVDLVLIFRLAVAVQIAVIAQCAARAIRQVPSLQDQYLELGAATHAVSHLMATVMMVDQVLSTRLASVALTAVIALFAWARAHPPRFNHRRLPRRLHHRRLPHHHRHRPHHRLPYHQHLLDYVSMCAVMLLMASATTADLVLSIRYVAAGQTAVIALFAGARARPPRFNYRLPLHRQLLDDVSIRAVMLLMATVTMADLVLSTHIVAVALIVLTVQLVAPASREARSLLRLLEALSVLPLAHESSLTVLRVARFAHGNLIVAGLHQFNRNVQLRCAELPRLRMELLCLGIACAPFQLRLARTTYGIQQTTCT